MLIVGLSLLLLHCNKTDNSLPQPVNPPPATSAKKYLALGDSYTIGQSVPETDRFPAQTKKWLADQGFNMNDPLIIATTGWTTTDLQNAVAAQNPAGPYDVVSLLIGVNDQYRWHDTTGYRNRFLQLLNKSIQLAGSRRDHVFVLSIPDYSVTPFGQNLDTALIRLQIDQLNEINKEVTLQNNCQYLDITPSTREAANDLSLIAGDGLHPSVKEYKKWADRLGPMMKTVLQ
ncbi:MAG TPA: SGNH/GDSL hydrolase family protein [Chitinophagaceae bacterium]|nr:SGNH/GDSL hydrolase family protein [Chitinophagaceae bacterium]